MQYVEDLTSPTGGDRNKADQKIMPLKEGSEQSRPKNSEPQGLGLFHPTE